MSSPPAAPKVRTSVDPCPDERAPPMTPAREPRSPSGPSGSSQSQAFIYPMKSAVSVKPLKRQQSEAGSIGSRQSGTAPGPAAIAEDAATTVDSALGREPAGRAGSGPDSLNRLTGSSLTTDEISIPPPLPANEDDEDASRIFSFRRDFQAVAPTAEDEGRASTGYADSTVDPSEKERLEGMTQHRFKHVTTEDGHMVVVGRDGELARCEDEPIHIPGAVQGFGCMIVVREDDEGQLVVRQASENTGTILGLSTSYLFKIGSFLDCLDEDQADVLWDNIEMLDESDKDLTESGPHVFQLSGWGQPGPGTGKARARRHWHCWCAAHRPEKQADLDGRKPLTVLEFELVNDTLFPLTTKTPPPSPGVSVGGDPLGGSETASTTGAPSVTTVDSDGTTRVSSVPTSTDMHGTAGLEGMPFVPTTEQFLESTQSTSKPLKALARLKGGSGAQGAGRRARPRKAGGGGGPGFSVAGGSDESGASSGAVLDLFGILSQANEQLSAQTDLQGFLKVVVGIVREITGFSRVMVYQFDERWNGQVVCELVDWNDTHDLYRGLHFPASDIPKQARELYVVNKVRLLYDRDQRSARMVCRDMEDLEQPVDMSHSYLRAMSPIHVQYLANMGVRASMSISIVAFDQLWGLIALHTYGSHGKRVSFPMRQLCRLLGESVSRNIERLSYTRRLSARKLINTLPTDRNPSGYIISNAEDLLKLFDADFGVIAIGNEAKILGPLNASQEVLAVTEYLRIKKFQHVLTSQDVSKDFPDMILPKGLEVIAGLLLVPLSSSGIDFITFLRKAQTRHVNWAGKPFKQGKENGAALEPRKSFKVWSETVTGTCRAWKDEELETASVLCLVYGKFISVWRQREQAMQYNQLNKLLLSNASHEVRTPLNHIINYLELALDSQLDSDTRENLSKSHMASKSLLFVINDLLDLTRQEQGNKLFLQEPFDLAATVREAVEMHEWEARRRKIQFSVVTDPDVLMVLGDKNRLRQVVTNTVTNSVKHTDQGHIDIELRRHTADETTNELPEGCDIEVELVVSDTGVGIPRERLEAIFREFEQVESVIADPSLSSDEQGRIIEDDAENAVRSGGTDNALGLGLAIVARIVRNLGGQLRVDSTVGEGSRFAYYIPFQQASAEDMARGNDSEASIMRRSNSRGSGASAGSSGHSEINSLVEAISASHLDDSGEGQRRASVDSRALPGGGPSRTNSGGANGHPAVGMGARVKAVPSAGPTGASAAAAGPGPRFLGQQNAAAMGIDGQRPIDGSAVPLRSVKVDVHSLDSSEGSALRAQGRDEKARSDNASYARTAATMRADVRSGVKPQSPLASASNGGSNGSLHPQQAKPPSASSSKARSVGSVSSGGSNSTRRTLHRTKPSPKPTAIIKEKLAHLRVLVVEDDPINRMILKKRLAMDGHAVSLAVNGEEGVRAFEKSGHEIDVILMDLQMPICNGQDACRRIRSREVKSAEEGTLADRPAAHVLNGRIPIFAVSATLTLQMRQEMLDIGMDGWMLKPIDFARLNVLLKGLTHLETRERERWTPGKNWEKGGWLSLPADRPVTDGSRPV